MKIAIIQIWSIAPVEQQVLCAVMPELAEARAEQLRAEYAKGPHGPKSLLWRLDKDQWTLYSEWYGKLSMSAFQTIEILGVDDALVPDQAKQDPPGTSGTAGQ